MRICDSAGSKWDREEVESKDAWICHWGKKGLQGSVLTTSSCLTNGGAVFRIDLRRRPDLGDFVVNVTCLFLYNLSSSSFLSWPFPSFLIRVFLCFQLFQKLALHHPNHTLSIPPPSVFIYFLFTITHCCLSVISVSAPAWLSCLPPFVCFLYLSPSFFLSTFSYFSVYSSHRLLFSGGRAD